MRPVPVLRRAVLAGALVPLLMLLAAGVAEAATLTVTNNHNSGPGSLRAKIIAAHSGDTVVIPKSIAKITLTTGQIAIDEKLTIKGAGATITKISGNQNGRIFCIQVPACPAALSGTQPAVTISGMTLMAGKYSTPNSLDGGGAIYN